jgi:hypothetical protein
MFQEQASAKAIYDARLEDLSRVFWPVRRNDGSSIGRWLF